MLQFYRSFASNLMKCGTLVLLVFIYVGHSIDVVRTTLACLCLQMIS